MFKKFQIQLVTEPKRLPQIFQYFSIVNKKKIYQSNETVENEDNKTVEFKSAVSKASKVGIFLKDAPSSINKSSSNKWDNFKEKVTVSNLH